MACKSCAPSLYKKSLSIKPKVIHNPQVRENELFEITVPVFNKGYLGSFYGRVCLYEGSSVFLDSGSFKVGPRETLDIPFTGAMPGHHLKLKASLIIETFGFVEICQDAETFTIVLAAIDQPTLPPIPPVTVEPVTPGVEPDEKPWWDPTGWGDDDDDDKQGLGDWIMDNLVLILVLILIIILVIKFG